MMISMLGMDMLMKMVVKVFFGDDLKIMVVILISLLFVGGYCVDWWVVFFDMYFIMGNFFFMVK